MIQNADRSGRDRGRGRSVVTERQEWRAPESSELVGVEPTPLTEPSGDAATDYAVFGWLIALAPMSAAALGVDHAQHVPERAERRAGSRDHWGDGGTGRPRRPCGGGPPPLARVDPAGTGGMESPAAASRASGVSIRSREVASSGMGGGDCWRVVASGRGLGGGDGCSPVSGVCRLAWRWPTRSLSISSRT